MTAWQAFVAIDFVVAVAVAFVSGWLFGRTRGYERGFAAGTHRGGKLAAHYFAGVEPTAGARR
jgi:hypothetical protein